MKLGSNQEMVNTGNTHRIHVMEIVHLVIFRTTGDLIQKTNSLFSESRPSRGPNCLVLGLHLNSPFRPSLLDSLQFGNEARNSSSLFNFIKRPFKRLHLHIVILLLELKMTPVNAKLAGIARWRVLFDFSAGWEEIKSILTLLEYNSSTFKF